MKRPITTYRVDVPVSGKRTFCGIEKARTAGAAARRVFRECIAAGFIKNTPPSSSEGGWEGVSISVA